jgi:serine/threonine protein kinase
MNAEALIGTVLGTCTLQRLIGQGGMGAVYLAQQSRPRRQVAVKVLMPMTPLRPDQLAAFLERFRRETDAAASLEHPNIVPVYEYGEREGLAYLVMPYISGGTLRDEMERLGTLPFDKVVRYLDQIAAALDFAHEHGVVHRDIKPANILMTPEGRLLLTDFGLVKIVAEGQAPQARLTGVGVPVGTPDYMAPEQVIGEGVDGRADLYSLGVILYQMVTGTTPFQGETPMQIAAQHLQIPPPSPQMLRPDLPVATEQVILRALAKRPAMRYQSGKELADAFRASLIGTGIALYSGIDEEQLLKITNSQLQAVQPEEELALPTSALPALKTKRGEGSGLLSRATGRVSALMPTAQMPEPVTRTGGLLSRTGKFPQVGTGVLPTVYATNATSATNTAATMNAVKQAQIDDAVAVESASSTEKHSATLPVVERQMSPVLGTTSAALPVAGQPGGTSGLRRNTVKLSSPVKVVQVPVAGQPGQFVTGLLPVTTPVQQEMKKPEMKLWARVMAAILVCLLLASMAGAVWFFRTHADHPTMTQSRQPVAMSTPNAQATAIARATATAQANIILYDPLSTNIHGWLTTPPNVYAFKDGAYHITDIGDSGRATVLQGENFTGPLGYTLTMEEIKGDDTSAVNSFGMIIRFSQSKQNGKMVTTFYSFEVVNTKGGEYQFWKYDSSQSSPWTELWHQPFGTEFHQGQGPQNVNTVKIDANGSNFTFVVNGTVIKTVQDSALKSGTIGMIVNLNGTEVAFKNLLLTRN